MEKLKKLNLRYTQLGLFAMFLVFLGIFFMLLLNYITLILAAICFIASIIFIILTLKARKELKLAFDKEVENIIVNILERYETDNIDYKLIYKGICFNYILNIYFPIPSDAVKELKLKFIYLIEEVDLNGKIKIKQLALH